MMIPTAPTLAMATLLALAGCASDEAPRAAAAGESATASRTMIPATPGSVVDSLITPTAIGGIELGTTLAGIRAKLPSATFERASDGEGIALVRATLAPDATLLLWTGEEDADAPIDWSSRVRSIEATGPAFATPEGVRVGSRIADVVRRYGPIREVVRSEIESREYVTFARQPAHLTLRLDYSGVFAEGARTTREVGPDASLHSISIEHHP